MDVGLELRQARERSGLSLFQLSKITKIGLRRLQAIEDSDEHNLPATVFTRSFVKSYAAEVGLDPNETWRRYAEQFEPPDAPGDGAPLPEPAPEQTFLDSDVLQRARVIYGRFGTGVVLIFVSLTVLAMAGKNYRQAQAEAALQTPPPVVGTAGLAPAPAAPAAVVGTSGTTPAPANGLRLTIAPTGACWIQAMAGDQKVLASLLNAGDRRTVDAPPDVTLRIGDPATCAFSIDGAPARVSGTPGRAVTIHLTKENYRQFLAK